MAKDILNATKMLDRLQRFDVPLRVYEKSVPESWTDFNGHMNEAHYLECFSNASDALMQLIGCDEAYIAAGKSYFTVETHICHLDEVRAGEAIYVVTQVLDGSGKKLHLFHSLYRETANGEDDLLATGEQMLLHVDLSSRKTCPPEGELAEALRVLCENQSRIPNPKMAGRAIGKKL